MEETVKLLSEAFGPSGDEGEVRLLIKDLVKDRADRIFEDSLGSLFITLEGPAPKIMISAHMDEIGIIVTHINENGFLRLAPVGGISPHLLVGQRLRFKDGTAGTVYHEKIKERKELDWSKLYLDIGLKDNKEAENGVRIGEVACLDQPFKALSGGRFMAKAMDDRAGCALLVETIKNLPTGLPHEICFVFTVQEELGLRGAKTAAYRCGPDYGLAVDVTAVGDTPKAPTMAVSLGKGPAVKVKDRSVFCHPRVRRLLVETAEKHGIPYQLEVLERGGTDIGAVHISREGVPSGAVSLPCRYVHTSSEIIDGGDLHHASDLLQKVLTATWPNPEELHGE